MRAPARLTDLDRCWGSDAHTVLQGGSTAPVPRPRPDGAGLEVINHCKTGLYSQLFHRAMRADSPEFTITQTFLCCVPRTTPCSGLSQPSDSAWRAYLAVPCQLKVLFWTPCCVVRRRCFRWGWGSAAEHLRPRRGGLHRRPEVSWP